MNSYGTGAVTALDSPLFGGGFSDDKMRGIFTAEQYVSRCVEVEVALAKVQAELGIIPQDAAEGIRATAAVFQFDMEKLRCETENVGYPILPIVEQLAGAAGEAGRYLHWGATTQDIMDSATVLQVRDGLDLISARIGEVDAALRDLAGKHRDTPMAGRTHLQHALPVTFGYKAAVWLSAMERHEERLAQLKVRALLGQFSGASGTLASLGDRGIEVQEGLCKELGLAVPAITWHSVRDPIAEVVQFLALLTGTLGKIAFDIAIMMTTEIGEVSEPFAKHRGASSTMPQKQNPISCELILAAGKVVRQHAGLMLDAMVHDFERATGPWHLEWFAVPESFALTSGALSQAAFLLGGLQVYPDRMRRNLISTGGLIVAEAVMMALAPHTGRQAAHDLVYASCRRALAEGRTLGEVLIDTPEIASALDADDMAWLVEPGNYLGSAPQMVDRVLAGR
jgi:3-carboxy-cis,cis-muconate cycloisomerase